MSTLSELEVLSQNTPGWRAGADIDDQPPWYRAATTDILACGVAVLRLVVGQGRIEIEAALDPTQIESSEPVVCSGARALIPIESGEALEALAGIPRGAFVPFRPREVLVMKPSSAGTTEQMLGALAGLSAPAVVDPIAELAQSVKCLQRPAGAGNRHDRRAAAAQVRRARG